MKSINHDMRTYRRQTAFTQQDIAEIIGVLDTSQVCRLETSPMHPQILLAFLYMLLFHVPLDALFPMQYRELKAILSERVPKIIDSLVCNDLNEEANQKIGSLQQLLDELTRPIYE